MLTSRALSQVITLDMGLLVAGTKYRGEFEERLKKLMEEIKQNDDIILVSHGLILFPAALSLIWLLGFARLSCVFAQDCGSPIKEACAVLTVALDLRLAMLHACTRRPLTLT